MALLMASTLGDLSNSLKRQRDEDEETIPLTLEFKKLRTLPFRPSPTSKPPSLLFSQSHRVSLLPVLTPGDDSDDDSDSDLESPPFRLPLSIHTNMPRNLENEDYDMEDSTGCISPAWSPKTTSPIFQLHTRPARLRSSSQLSTASSIDNSRIPTPIYTQFSSLSFSPVEGSISSPMPGFSPGNLRARSNALDDEAKHALFLRRRCLPSPISEIDMDFDSSRSPTLSSISQSQRIAHDGSGFGIPPTPVSSEFTKGMTQERGRKRSDAISNGVGCGQVGQSGQAGNVVFAMGFRMGCERCKERVPGHSSHIFRRC